MSLHLQRRLLVKRFWRHSAIVVSLLTVALAIGAIGYRVLEGLPWLDATLNAAMLLTGMGLVSPVERSETKVFVIVYAMGSGVFFMTMVAVLLAPAVQHFLHRFHLELDETRRGANNATQD